MRKISNACLLILFMAAGCRPEPYHLPQDKMQSVLTDIQLAEVYSTMVGFDTVQKVPVKNNDSLAKYYSEVLHHHNITLDQFKQSLDWYRQHPDVLDTIYVKAMNKLGKSNAFNRVRPGDTLQRGSDRLLK